MTQPQIILTGFADEGVSKQPEKSIKEQFTAYAAIGLQYYSIRFIDVGNGTKNVMNLTMDEIQTIREVQNDFGLNVSSIGSPIGKVKLVDVDDGTKNRYVPFKDYMDEVNRACEITHALESKLIRGFSFYHPHGADVHDYMNQAVDQLSAIAETPANASIATRIMAINFFMDDTSDSIRGMPPRELSRLYILMR